MGTKNRFTSSKSAAPLYLNVTSRSEGGTRTRQHSICSVTNLPLPPSHALSDCGHRWQCTPAEAGDKPWPQWSWEAGGGRTSALQGGPWEGEGTASLHQAWDTLKVPGSGMFFNVKALGIISCFSIV